MLGLAHRGFTLNSYHHHLVPFLGRNGYYTVLCGVQHEAAGCFEHAKGAGIIGYDQDITTALPHRQPDGNETAYWDQKNAMQAARWLTDNDQAPFFLSCGLFATHREYPFPPVRAEDTLRPLPKLANTQENRIDHARFLEAQRVTDRCFRTVMDALKRSRYADDTLVLITTDHGIAVPFSKCCLNTEGLGVSLSIKVPGIQPAQQFTDALVSTVDVFPTLCDVLGLHIPDYVQGSSFAHLFRRPEEEHREFVFSEVNFHTSYEPMRAARTRTFNLIKNYDEKYPFTHISNIDNSPAKTLLLDNGFDKVRKEPVELYNLATDPQEQCTLIGSPVYHEQAKKLQQQLFAWQQETEDPLLQGKILPPPGCKVNVPECVHPDSDNPADYL